MAPKSGWTLIKKAEEANRLDPADSIESGSYVADEGPSDADVEGDMIMTDMDSEVTSLDRKTTSVFKARSKSKENPVREDVDEIVHGM